MMSKGMTCIRETEAGIYRHVAQVIPINILHLVTNVSCKENQKQVR